MNRIRKLKNPHLLVILILLIAVGQMAQTIYVPTVASIAHDLLVHSGMVQQVMAAYLMTYGFSQFIYGPLSDRTGRKPVILIGLMIFMIGTIGAFLSKKLLLLVAASAIQGMGTGVAGVMARTMPRDLYAGKELRYANSFLNMGILVSPLLAPVIGGSFARIFSWRACYVFLLALCMSVVLAISRWLPETRPSKTENTRMFSIFINLLANNQFSSYLFMLIGALAGIAVFEASCGVLMDSVLGLGGGTVSILFILPIPAAFFGAWYAGREKPFHQLMWHSVMSCIMAGFIMWVPSWFGVMNIWTLLVPAAIFFFGAGMLFPLATTSAMEPFPYLAGAAGALVGGMQNIGSGIATFFSALLPQNGQGSLGMLMFTMALLIFFFWFPLSIKQKNNEQENIISNKIDV